MKELKSVSVGMKCWLTLVDYRKLTYTAMSRSLSCSWDDLCNSSFFLGW